MIDTNVILDDMLNRAPNAEIARKISQLVTDKYVNGYITANCLTDIFYIVSKSRNDVIARKTIRNLLLLFTVVSVNGQDCQKAIDSFMRDFEDALVVVCAEKMALNYIVTNDKDFLGRTNLSVPAVSPADFLLKLGG
jgi:putative PIN family toxin of toxin-antitoxin system